MDLSLRKVFRQNFMFCSYEATYDLFKMVAFSHGDCQIDPKVTFQAYVSWDD